MKHLYLMRHAKSSLRQAGAADHERPLDPRGRQAATLMGDHLLRLGTPPDLVLSSTARRARETCELVAARFGAVPVRYSDKLYLASAGALLKSLRRLPGEPAAVLVIGHNPGLQELALSLAAKGDPALLARLKAKFPTGAVTLIEFAAKRWVEAGAGRLLRFVAPSELA